MDATKPEVLADAPTRETVEGEIPEITALVVRAQEGDADAFAGLMRTYERRIIALGRQMGLSREDAQDACQDAFVKVFRYIGRFRSGHSFYKWLYRIAIHAVYDHARRGRRPGTISLDEAGEGIATQLKDAAVPLAERVEAEELAGKLLAGLDSLSRRERIVFVLRDLQEMETEEIGSILGLSQITVRRHCMSARQKLRDRLFPRRD